MHRCAVVPYEGSEPYIFVSYAHKDAAQVYPIMEALYSRGYRIWYDDGIAPGSEWPENIAQHLSDSTIILACVSPNSIASDNCRREVTFALSKHKAFLGLILEPTKMSLGMEMQLSAQQCIMKYSYADAQSFINKVCSCPELAACKVPQPAPAPETAAPVDEKPQAPQKPEKPAKQPKAPRIKKEKPAKSPVTKAKRRKALLLVAAILVTLIAAAVISYFASHVRVGDERIFRGETYLSLYGENVTADMVRSINKLKKLQTLSADDCQFEDGAMEQLRPSDTLKYVYITDSTGVSSLSWLTELENLYTLSLRNCAVSDLLLPQLSAQNLHNVNLSQNPDISDLYVLEYCHQLTELDVSDTGVQDLSAIPVEKLVSLNFAGSQVADVSGLVAATNLEYLDGSGSQVSYIGALAPLQQLKQLRFNNCPLLDPNEVFFCLRLQDLQLCNTQVTKLDAFANCTVLETVNLAGTAITDISVLEKSAAALTQVYFSHMPLGAEQLQFLGGNSQLTHVYVDGIPMENLDILSSTTQLKSLSAGGCGLKDIQGISQNTGLEFVCLAGNQITDVSPLQAISKEWGILDLSGNPVSDVSALPKVYFDALFLVDTQLDPGTLAGLKGSRLVLRFDPAMAQGALKAEDFGDIYLVDSPADQMVALEEAIGKYGLTFLQSRQELAAMMAELGLDYRFLETE